MKRTIVILSIVLTLSVAGVLYGKHLQTDQREAVALEEAHAAQFSEHMFDLVLDPMVIYPVY